MPESGNLFVFINLSVFKNYNSDLETARDAEEEQMRAGLNPP